jgi:hypothetical protein
MAITTNDTDKFCIAHTSAPDVSMCDICSKPHLFNVNQEEEEDGTGGGNVPFVRRRKKPMSLRKKATPVLLQ